MDRRGGSPPLAPTSVCFTEAYVTDSRPRPTFTGLLVHRDVTHRYSILVPDGWHRREVADDAGTGVLYAPSTEDVFTGFFAQARDLGTAVTAADLPTLRAGFLSGLRKLPRSRIEAQEAEAIGRLITMEGRHTFRDGDVTRKRWVRLLYQDTIQLRLVAQGATVAEFGYWLPMFYESMRTVRFGDWWADATGRGWQTSLLDPEV
jgi:hypothetical protein